MADAKKFDHVVIEDVQFMHGSGILPIFGIKLGDEIVYSVSHVAYALTAMDLGTVTHAIKGPHTKTLRASLKATLGTGTRQVKLGLEKSSVPANVYDMIDSAPAQARDLLYMALKSREKSGPKSFEFAVGQIDRNHIKNYEGAGASYVACLKRLLPAIDALQRDQAKVVFAGDSMYDLSLTNLMLLYGDELNRDFFVSSTALNEILKLYVKRISEPQFLEEMKFMTGKSVTIKSGPMTEDEYGAVFGGRLRYPIVKRAVLAGYTADKPNAITLYCYLAGMARAYTTGFLQLMKQSLGLLTDMPKKKKTKGPSKGAAEKEPPSSTTLGAKKKRGGGAPEVTTKKTGASGPEPPPEKPKGPTIDLTKPEEKGDPASKKKPRQKTKDPAASEEKKEESKEKEESPSGPLDLGSSPSEDVGKYLMIAIEMAMRSLFISAESESGASAAPASAAGFPKEAGGRSGGGGGRARARAKGARGGGGVRRVTERPLRVDQNCAMHGNDALCDSDCAANHMTHRARLQLVSA